MTTALAEANALRARLVDQLRARGLLHSAQWHRVFSTIPRHPFVPVCYVPDPAGLGDGWLRLDSRDGVRWLQAVYSDRALVTRLDEDGLTPPAPARPRG